MKLLLLKIFLLCNSISFAQNWVKIPGTRIMFSNLIHANQDNWYDYYFEYFKKGDSIIVIGKSLAKDFYDVFKNSPNAFESIIGNCVLTNSKIEKDLLDSDSTILKIPFKIAVILTTRQLVIGYNEVIWIMKNVSLERPSSNPCFLNIIFQKKSASKPFRFLSTINQYCEI